MKDEWGRDLDINPADPWSDAYCPTDVTCDPWPAWVEGFREQQLEAVELILDAYKRGVRFVVLDAPVGAGKTLIAEMVRRRLGERMLYVAHSRGLQDQFLRDFPYAKVLKGRSNYPTTRMPVDMVTASDCMGPKKCRYCEGYASCPYNVAKAEAREANVAVVNTAYMVNEAGGRKSVCRGGDGTANPNDRRGFTVIDECDTLEGILADHVSFRIGQADGYGLEELKKGVHGATIAKWIEDEWMPNVMSELHDLTVAMEVGGGEDVKQARRRKKLVDMVSKGRRAAAGIRDGGWVRDYEWGDRAALLVLKPVYVDWVAKQKIWDHAERWLCMSGTVIDSRVWAESLGLEEGEWEGVEVGMTFPAENRPVRIVPVGNMAKKQQEESLPKVMKAVGVILDRHKGDNVLIHTVSYKLNQVVVDVVKESGHWGRGQIHTYSSARDRDGVLEAFKQRGGVLIGPSLDRGVDLPGDLCRVQICVKVPFPNLGDRRVGERMRGPGGQRWYGAETARTMVQMTGRGVRGVEDYAVTYIVDQGFLNWFNKDGKGLLPAWWIDAMTVDRVKEYQ